MRPLHNNSPKESEHSKAFWEAVEKAKRVDYSEEKEVFHLTKKEAENCRYTITDQTMRLAMCTVHTVGFTHGLTLHPPHLWDIKDGILYKKVGETWVRFIPDVEENKKRFT